MIEILEGLPDNVVGLVVKGRVTQRDCAETLLPAIEKARDWHHRLRLYYEIRSRYPGAAWDELRFGAAGAPAWERVAVVSDVAWIRHAVQAFRLLIPSEIRVFATPQIPQALTWIAATSAQQRRPATVAAEPVEGERGRTIRLPAQYLHQAL
jgi:hypothetical protein